jgi:hypothetical protein
VTGPLDEPALQAEIARLLEAQHLDPSYAAFVRNHLDVPGDGWRWCCGSNCDPCVEELARVVDAVRRRLGR